MKRNPIFKRSLAWTLIVSLIAPALPAWAQVPPNSSTGDFVIYTSSSSGGASQPNILLLIDTSDSMNIAEPWREYPGAYDSHVEYLWNDINRIRTSEQTTEHSDRISTAAQPALPFSKYGFWAGATLADRQALWTAARTYANATEPNAAEPDDPGARSIYRNYSDASWLYWLPTGAAETDRRLMSIAFNRFRGDIGEIAGTRGGIAWSNVNNYTAQNKCESSKASLLPSTVFAPTAYPRNAGKLTNQRWLRYENWLGLTAVNNAGYPGSSISTAGYAEGYLNSSLAPPNTAYRDNVGSSPTGSQGQPIRIQGAGFAGWTDLKADLGGYNFQATVNNMVTAYLTTLRGSDYYNYGLVAANEKFSAWKGNRDATPAFGRETGTPAYFDTPPAACDALTGPAHATCINVTTGGAAAHTVTKTRACTYNSAGSSTEIDALGTLRRRGGSCTDGVVTCSDPNPGVNPPQCDGIVPAQTPADPGLCALNPDNTFINLDRRLSAWSPARASVSIATCNWVGRQSTYIEGSGWFYYGGSCTENASTASCTMGGSTRTIGGTSYNNVTGPIANPGLTPAAILTTHCSNAAGFAAGSYYHGSTCQGSLNSVGTVSGTPAALTGPADAPANSTISGVTNPKVIRGTSYANVVFGSATAGCNDNADNNQGCTARYGLTCVNTGSACPNQTSSLSGGGAAATNRFYSVYNRSSFNDYLIHDCTADDSAGGYMRAANRTFGAAWNSGAAPGSATDSYSTSSGHAIAVNTDRHIDVYSVNYLNWKFGPKGPNGHPIGRKTRLQIAKDALSDLVATTNGVRFGLMVFNKTDTTNNAEGGNIAYKMTDMGPKNCSLASPTTTASITAGSTVLTLASNPGFGAGNAITVPGAGAAGSSLNATILSVTGTTVTLSTTAGTTVTGVTVAVPPCTPAETASYANRAALINKINGLVAASRTPLAESLFESYRYFRGEAPLFGRLTTTAGAGGAVAAGCDRTAFATPGGGADCTASSGNYVSPMMSSLDPTTGQPAACQKNFIVLMTDGGPEDDFSANAAIKTLSYAGAAGTVSPDTRVDQTQADTAGGQFESAGLPYGPTDLAGTASDGGYIWLDELAYYMSAADMNTAITGRQPVTTYTIGFAGANTPVLQQAASRSGGNNYVANDSDELAAALTAAIASIREWNPTVASPTVPLSALNRSESGEQVYVAFFGPSNSQAWEGTVKQFRFGEGEAQCGRTTTPDAPIDLCLIGKTVLSGATVKNIEKVETDPVTGEQTITVNPAAVSFWNPSNTQDGSKPNVGGSGQRLKDDGVWTPATRKVHTFIMAPGTPAESVSASANLLAAGNAVSETNTALLTKTRLGNAAMSDAQRATLINFIRGGNPSDASCADASAATLCTVWRTWPHHDVLHSRPVLITYNPTAVADPEVSGGQLATAQYLFYLSNDGLLRAVDTRTGAEKWSFLVEEALPGIAAVKNNLAGQHLTLADGAPSVWLHDANGDGIIGNAAGEKAHLFFGLRRGGRAYYALDVTDVDNPRLMWKITDTMRCVGTACAATADFAEMGYTWSTPAIGKLRAIADASVPALVIGGGYDPNQDNASVSAADTMGRGVFVIRGDDATLLRAFTQANTAGMDFSIPSDVMAINADLDSQNLLDRAYVGDMAANVWRFDINNTNPATWAAKKLASLSDPFALPATAPNRKILFPPSVVKQNFKGQRYDAVYVGTGDREHPLNPAGSDKMFMLKDTGTGHAASAEATIAFPGNLVNITTAFTSAAFDAALGGAAWSTKTGWYFDFAAGEKLSAAQTVFKNVLRFPTYSPNLSVSACVPPGKGVLYGMSALDGSVVADTYTSGTPQERRQYIGQAGRGYIPGGTLIVRGKKVFEMYGVAGSGGPPPKQVGTIGGASSIYWYRESAR